MPPAPRKPSAPVAIHSAIAVVGIGASAGGLEACSKLLDALPTKSGMAFILVQHLDPDHSSMMAELLSSHAVMRVTRAAEGMPVKSDNHYIIPPSAYLTVVDGMLHLSAPREHTVRACRLIICWCRWHRPMVSARHALFSWVPVPTAAPTLRTSTRQAA